MNNDITLTVTMVSVKDVSETNRILLKMTIIIHTPHI